MRRAVAAGFAATITSMAFYKFDSMKTAYSLGIQPNKKVFKGILPESISSFTTTLCYFEIYEESLRHTNPVVSAALGRSVSSFIDTPFSIMKKRRQLNKPVFPISVKTFSNTYLLSLIRGIPNNCLKYALYEILLKMTANLPNLISGGFSAFASAIICSYIFFPLEALKNRVIIHGTNSTHTFQGSNIATLHSLLCNTFGHALLELWAPRSV